MKYLIARHDREDDDNTSQEFRNYYDAYDLAEEIYGDTCCSNATYKDPNYHEIIKGF